MPSEQVVAQQIQVAEPMTADSGAVEVQQPVSSTNSFKIQPIYIFFILQKQFLTIGL